MSKTIRSRRNRHPFANQIRQRLWLVIPLGSSPCSTQMGSALVNSL